MLSLGLSLIVDRSAMYFFEDIDLGLAPLASMETTILKKPVNLAKGAALGLRKTEKAPDPEKGVASHLEVVSNFTINDSRQAERI